MRKQQVTLSTRIKKLHKDTFNQFNSESFSPTLQKEFLSIIDTLDTKQQYGENILITSRDLCKLLKFDKYIMNSRYTNNLLSLICSYSDVDYDVTQVIG